jgi:hypothetical protein
MALCCDLGIVAKKMIVPAANLVTDALHIPGGVGTSFSLMFLVVGAVLTGQFGCGALMGVIQSGIALALGSTGSLGILSPIGYVIPGLAIDLALWAFRQKSLSAAVMTACIAGPLAASLTANLLVFRLHGVPLLLYLCVACTTGAICGVVAIPLLERLCPLINAPTRQKGNYDEEAHCYAADSDTCRNRPV